MTDSTETLTTFFNYVDADGDGVITIAEIIAACAVDIDGDGTVTEAEAAIGAAPWLADLSKQDVDGSQTLTLQELLNYNA